MNVLKALGTYYHDYRAASACPTRERLALVTRPLILLDARPEPTPREQARGLVCATADVRIVPVGPTLADRADAIADALIG